MKSSSSLQPTMSYHFFCNPSGRLVAVKGPGSNMSRMKGLAQAHTQQSGKTYLTEGPKRTVQAIGTNRMVYYRKINNKKNRSLSNPPFNYYTIIGYYNY